MVGRLEMLSADRQRKAEAAIASLVSRDSSERARAYRFLHEQGRYVEPIVRHVAKTTKDENVKALCRRLLLTDFVTDLRAAIHNAATESRSMPIRCSFGHNWRGCCARRVKTPRPVPRQGRARGA